MKILQKPVNDWSRTLWILNDSYIGGVSMAKVLTNYAPCFYKFQTRLLEIQKVHPNFKISKVQIPFKNAKINKSGYFTQYTVLNSKSYLHNLYNKINKEGLKEKTNTPNEQ